MSYAISFPRACLPAGSRFCLAWAVAGSEVTFNISSSSTGFAALGFTDGWYKMFPAEIYVGWFDANSGGPALWRAKSVANALPVRQDTGLVTPCCQERNSVPAPSHADKHPALTGDCAGRLRLRCAALGRARRCRWRGPPAGAAERELLTLDIKYKCL